MSDLARREFLEIRTTRPNHTCQQTQGEKRFALIPLENLEHHEGFKIENQKAPSRVASGFNVNPKLIRPQVLALSEEPWDEGWREERPVKEKILLPIAVLCTVGGGFLILLQLPTVGGFIVTIGAVAAVLAFVDRMF